MRPSPTPNERAGKMQASVVAAPGRDTGSKRHEPQVRRPPVVTIAGRCTYDSRGYHSLLHRRAKRAPAAAPFGRPSRCARCPRESCIFPQRRKQASGRPVVWHRRGGPVLAPLRSAPPARGRRERGRCGDTPSWQRALAPSPEKQRCNTCRPWCGARLCPATLRALPIACRAIWWRRKSADLH